VGRRLAYRNVVGFLEPKPGIPPSPQHKLALVNLMLEKKVRVILMEIYFDRKDPDFVAARTGAKVLVLSPSVGGEKGQVDYVSLFDVNVAALVKALSGAGS
jgi:ABC-type Zn uptake system ZnuABC Zn-binding protein ZnuA